LRLVGPLPRLLDLGEHDLSVLLDESKAALAGDDAALVPAIVRAGAGLGDEPVRRHPRLVDANEADALSLHGLPFQARAVERHVRQRDEAAALFLARQAVDHLRDVLDALEDREESLLPIRVCLLVVLEREEEGAGIGLDGARHGDIEDSRLAGAGGHEEHHLFDGVIRQRVDRRAEPWRGGDVELRRAGGVWRLHELGGPFRSWPAVLGLPRGGVGVYERGAHW
jgi:hypothetical protein